ncbi:MAG: SEL1-like repeat protein [Chitinophaga sp.]|uniref:SEL1-like repeat protein n=1 Tax=Chitinophaga sp. TaxID=1869181 RepID=UPI0025BB29B3|nr:SEL1-like repeat protein [Chitinophaga sp.]MBV8255536.1 SEL1-like repeat protein [Chitinophaga sp.]
MSHRMYLYNLDQVPEKVAKKNPLPGYNSDEVTMMMEWKYEFPLFFHPLFSDKIKIAPPIYNGEEGGLYAAAFPGIDAFRAFYAFIEKHGDQLLDDKAAFQEAQLQIRKYFRRKVHLSWFHLDAWDVFNIEDDGFPGSHTLQAEKLKASMEENNRIIQAAIAADDPALLDSCPFLKETGWAKSFRQFLNEPVYGYGWEVIKSSIFEEEVELEVFIETDLKGLKDLDGNIVLPAEFDEIYEFPYGENRAVVTKQGKAGYIDKQGRLAIPCIYDDAFDFLGGYGHVVWEGKFLVIDEDDQMVILPTYEDGFLLGPELFAVSNKEEWGVIVPSGKFVLPMQPAKGIEVIKEGSTTYYKLEKPDGTPVWLSHTFHTLISGEATIEMIDGYYLITRGEEMALLDDAGNILLPFAAHHIHYDYNLQAYLVTDTSNTGIFLPLQGWLLPATFQQIKPLEYAGTAANGERYAIVEHHGEAGLFAIGANPHWVMPMVYKNFVLLKEGYLGFQDKTEAWGMANFEGRILSTMYFTSINGKQGCLTYGVALGFQHMDIYVLSEDGSHRRPTAQQIIDELAYYPDAFYSKSELHALTVLAESGQAALDAHAAGNLALDEERYEDAIKSFEQAIEGNCLEAITDLGYLYENAPGYQQPERGFSLYLKAAELGEKVAMNNVGLAYLAGRGTTKNIAKAVEWLEQAVKRYYSSAMATLGDVYSNPVYEMVDTAKALELYLQALDYREDVSQQIGHIYEQEQDYEKAAKYYQQAVDAGHAFSKWRLGLLYYDGKGVPFDLNKAMELYQGAVGEYPEVHLDIATLYMSPDFYNPKMVEAHYYMAKECGVPHADEYLAAFQLNGK